MTGAMVDRVDANESQQEADALRLSREDLLRHLTGIAGFLRDYGALIEGVSQKAPLGAEAEALLRQHQNLAREADSSLVWLTPMGHLLRYLLSRIRSPRITFRLPREGAPLQLSVEAESSVISGLSVHLSRIQSKLDGMMEQVLGEIKRNAVFQSPPYQMLLVSLASLCKAMIRQDWEDVELCLNHINLVTTSHESSDLSNNIGSMVRSIYQSLKELSGDYPADQLSSSAKEIPDAVENLYRVIGELENSANQNLDMLEKLNEQSNYDVGQARESIAVLTDCGDALKQIQKTHPDSAEFIKEIRTVLTEQVLVPLMDFQGVMEEFQVTYLSLLSNQSFQDLTGQTMKKVIAFIESLQYQLIQVVAKNSGQASTSVESVRDTSGEHGPDGVNRLSQDRVDNLLAELGF
ncbi:MAG: protein phosphatase CheZ [Deltaproteobacteria bacterium]|nr:protein phosphatase CheZ [Deltaproteobacteria bacterium]